MFNCQLLSKTFPLQSTGEELNHSFQKITEPLKHQKDRQTAVPGRNNHCRNNHCRERCNHLNLLFFKSDYLNTVTLCIPFLPSGLELWTIFRIRQFSRCLPTSPHAASLKDATCTAERLLLISYRDPRH